MACNSNVTLRFARFFRRLLPAAILLAAVPWHAQAAAPGSAVVVPVLAATPSLKGAIDASWSGAAKITLDEDFTYRRAAAEPTTVYIGQEHGYLDVAFAATQREPLTQSQVTNGASVESDDYVEVALDPQGIAGFDYAFYANPRGVRYQTSTENSAYSPQWSAAGSSTVGGYVVTMRIPLHDIRSGGSTVWRAQFLRYTVATNGLSVWTYSPQAIQISDPTYYGTLQNVGATGAAPAKAARPQPRAQIYALGERTTRAYGGSTSRVGADFSLPVTPTASFVATLHPDFSNVEIDQQTIAPTAFARQYAEVRPFFTQVGSPFNNHFACLNCPTTLYTPAIPTFSQGYALEGTQGLLNFSAFDAIGTGRSDNAQTVNYTYEDASKAVHVDLQRVGVVTPSLLDDTTTLGAGYFDERAHVGFYANSGVDSGTLVTNPSLASYLETGTLYAISNAAVAVSYSRVGAQFNPVDGYVLQPNVAGYTAFTQETLPFAAKSFLHDVTFTGIYARFDDDERRLAQTDATAQVNFDFRNLMTLHLYSTNQGVRTAGAEFLPFDANGAMIGYKFNTTTPTYVQYTAGPYYHGHLDAWTYLTTIPLAPHFHLALETDEDRYDTAYAGETSTTQWLERTSLDWQISRDAEFDVGVRRIVGPNLPNAFQTLAFASPATCTLDPYYPGCFVEAGNVSLAFHFLAAHNEFYVVYGNPNDLSTLPALFVKWIRYVGAEKGT